MSANTVNILLEERARLVAKNAATEGHLWAAEFLIHRCSKLLSRLIAEHPADAVALDVLIAECRELLTEPRPHPAAGTVDDAHWPLTPDVASPAGAAGHTGPNEGTGGASGTVPEPPKPRPY